MSEAVGKIQQLTDGISKKKTKFLRILVKDNMIFVWDNVDEIQEKYKEGDYVYVKFTDGQWKKLLNIERRARPPEEDTENKKSPPQEDLVFINEYLSKTEDGVVYIEELVIAMVEGLKKNYEECDEIVQNFIKYSVLFEVKPGKVMRSK